MIDPSRARMLALARKIVADSKPHLPDMAGFIRRPFDGAVGLIDPRVARSRPGSETEW
jgi:hypothetical protein